MFIFLSGCAEPKTNGKSTNLGLNQDKSMILGQLDPNGLQLLGKLISLVHKNVEHIGQDQYNPTDLNDESVETSNQPKQIANDGNAPVSVNGSIAQIFSSLEPLALQKMLLAMAV